MTYFYTCVGCVEQKTKCPVREVVRDAIRGQGVTSLRHRCVSRKDMFIPGQRVEVLTYSDLDFDSEYGPPPRVWFPAVIVSQFAARILVHIQPGVKDTTGEHEFCTKGNGYCKSRLGRVRSTQATDIVDMTRCDQCGAIPSLGDQCGDPFGDLGAGIFDQDFGPAPKCIARKVAA